MRALRLYVDSSVIGGCFDAEFAEESQRLVEMAEHGDVVLLVSDLLARELAEAPTQVIEMYQSLPQNATESVETTTEAQSLQEAYLKAGVVGPAAAADALHVALATVARADAIVSWNFRHIVHLEKIRGFNSVNMREGYGIIAIHSPKEVV
jgi:predicted nucleic acid-binding protein